MAQKRKHNKKQKNYKKSIFRKTFQISNLTKLYTATNTQKTATL